MRRSSRAHALPARVVVVADRELLAERARAARTSTSSSLDSIPRAARSRAAARSPSGTCRSTRPSTPGSSIPPTAAYVLRTLEVAADGCSHGTFDAMATAPVHKGVINDAGIAFTGHTEFLAERTGTPRVVMMLVGGGMRVALATTHLALRDVPAAITREGLARHAARSCAAISSSASASRGRACSSRA